MAEAFWRRGWVRWAAWLALLAAWTYGLLSPDAPEAVGSILPPPLRFWAAKGLHVGAYACLAFAAAWVPLCGRWLAWLGLHVVVLLSFRNRFAVLTNLTWRYLAYPRNVNVIVGN